MKPDKQKHIDWMKEKFPGKPKEFYEYSYLAVCNTSSMDDASALVEAFDREIRAIEISGHDFESWAKKELKGSPHKYSSLARGSEDQRLHLWWCMMNCNFLFNRRREEIENAPALDIIQRDKGFSLELFMKDILRVPNQELVLSAINDMYSKS